MDNQKFVGRAGEKLEFALTSFNISIKDKIVADFGSAVGGFVDCLLQHGARQVYAVETGYGVLDWKLRNDKRVKVLERSNAMHIKLPELVDLITIDTSWTRQENVIPNALKNLKNNGEIICLIKPHYEAEKKLLHHGKLEDQDAERVAKEVVNKIESFGLRVKGFIKSPIVGGKAGNSEYLGYFIRR